MIRLATPMAPAPFAAILLVALGAAHPARAQSVTASVKSVDVLLDDADFLLKHVAPPEAVGPLLDMLNQHRAPEALAGIDRTRSIGAWMTFPENPADPPTIAGAIPITNLDQAIQTLQKFGIEVQPADVPGFSHRITLPDGNTTLFLTATKDYAFLSLTPLDADKLKTTLPSSWMPRGEPAPHIAASLRLDQLPAHLREQFVLAVEQGAMQGREREPGETDSSYQARMTGMDLAFKAMKALIDEGADLSLGLFVDQAKGELAIELTASGRPDTEMQKALTAFGNRPSRFAAMAPESPASASINVPSPKEFQAVMAKSLEEARDQLMAAADDPRQLELATTIFDLMKPIFTAEHIDLRADLVGPYKAADGTNRFVLLGGVQAPNGKDINMFIREKLDQLPREEGVELQLDLAKANDGTPIHKLALPVTDEQARRIFGPTTLYAAVRDDALFFAFGVEGQAPLIEALNAAPRSATGASTAVDVTVRGKDVADLVAIVDADTGAQIAEAMRNAPAGQDTVRLSLAAPDGVLRLRASAGVAALKLAFMLGVTRQAAIANP